MNLQEERSELEQLVRVFSDNLPYYLDKKNNFNEQMTRQQFIDVFLKILGWDITNPRGLNFKEREIVAEEYSNSSTKDRPDYTIRMNGMSKFFVEAKKVSVDIKNAHESAFQTRRYGWNAGHGISVLTNFEYLAVYLTYEMPFETDSPSKFRYKLYHFTEYVDKFDEIYELLSRESVISGNFDSWIEKIKPEDSSKTSLDNVFLEQLNEWRVLVANDLICHDHDLSDYGDINESIQTFLNQLVFLRFVEDNRFESLHQLKLEISQHTDYRNYFNALNKKYNSTIFENSKIVNDLSNQTLTKIVNNLYFPNVSYDFSIIDLSILSKIYENFLQELIIIENGEAKLVKTKTAKIKSVISTPDELVVAIVKEALEPVLKGKTIDEILELKIADIAVGSGIFLIEAYNYIEKHLVELFSLKNEIFPDEKVVPFSIKRRVLEEVLWGFDINNQAVQLTRFSLLLRLLSKESKERVEDIIPILPSLHNNIICSNSLITDSDIDITRISHDDLFDIMPMNSNKENYYLFDVIIGNPPYLSTEDIKNSTPNVEILAYKKKFLSSFKQYDKYFLFIERSLQLLKSGGVSVLLVPNKFYTNIAGEKLRELLMKNGYLTKIYDFGSRQLFNGVINYVSVIKLEKSKSENLEYTEVSEISEVYNNKKGLKYPIHSLEKDYWFLTGDYTFKNKYYYTMEHFPKIEEEIEPSNGIQTSKNSVFIIKEREIIDSDKEVIIFKKNGRDYEIEKEILRKYYSPKKEDGVKKSYQKIESSSYVIFPYENGKVISSSIISKRFPKAWLYLNEYKSELLPKFLGGNRDVQGDASNTEWYQFGRTQALKVNDKEKLIVGVMSREPNFNIDRNNFSFSSGGTAGYISITLKNGTKYSLEYMQAWLSHSFTDRIFQIIGSDFEGGFYTHGTSLYKSIPLLPIDFDDNEEKSDHNKIKSLVSKIDSINNDIYIESNENKKEMLILVKNNIISEINDILDKLLEKKVNV
ncbi:Eco57I restriction-modification methylase domain-containing protein [Streptococcus uberis]|uniref:Eco57I restriction-modification methylase domain-containing protein n=1 Tax=Streptococcus uberis TaxID=1349 RepID=UPI00193A0638|nr:N-6 DNA methylase [Streptococcus uberis]